MSVDDHGTGYFSLAHLRSLPVDTLKIDRSFVTPMLTDEGNAVIVRSTIELAHNLGLRVVAEGVEDEVTRDALSMLGCRLAQGYYLSPPLPADRPSSATSSTGAAAPPHRSADATWRDRRSGGPGARAGHRAGWPVMDAGAWDERYAAADRVWSRGPNQFVATALAGLPPGDALDLACGEGRNASWLAGLGWRVTAIDFSPVAVARAQRLAEEAGVSVNFVVGDVLSAPLPEADLVVIAYLHLPAEPRRRAVRRAWGCLRRGGTFFLVAHDATNLTEGTGGPQDAGVLFTAADVLAALGDPGALDVVRAERVARVVTAEDPHAGITERVAWDALVHVVRR